MATTIPPLDLMFYLTESPTSPKHVGAVQVFKLPARAPANYLRDLVAEFKKAPVATPFNRSPHFPRFGMPEWREDENMDINYHVRHSALPTPGNTGQLMEVIQRLHSSMLDRARPGWICQVIEGLEGDRFAIYLKIHHAYIDGISGAKRLYGALNTSARDRKALPPWSAIPKRKKTRSRSTAKKPDSRGQLERQMTGLGDAMKFLGRSSLQWLKLRDGEAQIPYTASRTRMNRVPRWDSRSTAICTLPLDQVKAIGKKHGGTVNEVILAIIGAALHDYLEEHRENTRTPLVALCPMSIRSEGDDTASTQASAVLVRMGQPRAKIADRLHQVLKSSRAAKKEISSMSPEGMMDYGVLLFAQMELMQRSKLDQFISPSYNVLVSNVPGPGTENLYLRGSLLEASYPISTLLPGVNLNATVLSHGNRLDFGLMGDMQALPDLDLVARGMERHFAELAKKELKAPAKTPKKKSSRK